VEKENTTSGYELAKTMFEKTKAINTMAFTMGKLERINGKMVNQKSNVKLRRDPLTVYSKQTEPASGIEVLYKKGDTKALINPNGFPWVNLNLDPYGSTMRKDQHHTIHDAGYDLVVSILEHLFEKYGAESREMTGITGTEQWNGNACYVIDIKNPYFKFEDYTIKDGENLITIAEEKKLSEFMILENNPSLKDYYDVKKGQVIKIPNDYSPHFILYLDQERLIPLVMKIYDDKGLYEQYEYTNVELNVKFEAAEFTPEFHAYGF
jgi:outer membrane lipoprotein-sorting protein